MSSSLLALVALVTGHAATGAEAPKSGTEPAAKPVASRYAEQAKGENSAEMLRMLEAGKVEGRRDSLTFFRWSGNPPKLSHLGLCGPKVTNDIFALISTMPDLSFVSVYETAIDDDGVQALTKLPNLRYLSITPIIRYEKAGFGAPQWSYPFMKPVAGRPRVTGRGLRTRSLRLRVWKAWICLMRSCHPATSPRSRLCRSSAA